MWPAIRTSRCTSADVRGANRVGRSGIPRPAGEFLVTDEERLSFAEADAQSRTLADALLASGVGKGTRVGILFPNCAQWLISWLAAARIGALTVPLSTFAPGGELARLLRHTDVQVVLMGQSI